MCHLPPSHLFGPRKAPWTQSVQLGQAKKKKKKKKKYLFHSDSDFGVQYIVNAPEYNEFVEVFLFLFLKHTPTPHERSGSQKDQLISGNLKSQHDLCGDFSNFLTLGNQNKDQK